LDRPVLLLTPLAKAAATVGCVGGGLGIWGRLAEVPWAATLGTVLLLGGALVYFVERIRMSRRARSPEEP
jgi:hypothetical protein